MPVGTALRKVIFISVPHRFQETPSAFSIFTLLGVSSTCVLEQLLLKSVRPQRLIQTVMRRMHPRTVQSERNSFKRLRTA